MFQDFVLLLFRIMFNCCTWCCEAIVNDVRNVQIRNDTLLWRVVNNRWPLWKSDAQIILLCPRCTDAQMHEYIQCTEAITRLFHSSHACYIFVYLGAVFCNFLIFGWCNGFLIFSFICCIVVRFQRDNSHKFKYVLNIIKMSAAVSYTRKLIINNTFSRTFKQFFRRFS